MNSERSDAHEYSCRAGAVDGVPTFQKGKVTRLNEWLDKTQQSFEEMWFYSDSHNDLPLLEIVDHPVAVDADPELTQIATAKLWSQISLR